MMSMYSAKIPTHIVCNSTMISGIDQDDEDPVHVFVDNSGDDDDVSSIDDISCMSEDAYLELIRVGLYNFVVEATYNDLEDFGPPPVAVSTTTTKNGIGDDDSNNHDDDNRDDEISAISKSSSIREVLITSSEKKESNTTTIDCSAEEDSSMFSSYFPNTDPNYDSIDDTISFIDVPFVMNNYHHHHFGVSSDEDADTLSYISSSNALRCSAMLRRSRRTRRSSHNSVHTKLERMHHQAMKPIRTASNVASRSARKLNSVLRNGGFDPTTIGLLPVASCFNPLLFHPKTKNKKKQNRSVLLLNDSHDDDDGDDTILVVPTMIPLDSFELGSDEDDRNGRNHYDDCEYTTNYRMNTSSRPLQPVITGEI